MTKSKINYYIVCDETGIEYCVSLFDEIKDNKTVVMKIHEYKAMNILKTAYGVIGKLQHDKTEVITNINIPINQIVLINDKPISHFYITENIDVSEKILTRKELNKILPY